MRIARFLPLDTGQSEVEVALEFSRFDFGRFQDQIDGLKYKTTAKQGNLLDVGKNALPTLPLSTCPSTTGDRYGVSERVAYQTFESRSNW